MKRIAKLRSADEMLVDSEMTRIAETRLVAVRDGQDRLLEEDEFWVRAVGG